MDFDKELPYEQETPYELRQGYEILAQLATLHEAQEAASELSDGALHWDDTDSMSFKGEVMWYATVSSHNDPGDQYRSDWSVRIGEVALRQIWRRTE